MFIRILDILLSNAIKYTQSQKGCVTLKLFTDIHKKELTLTITDTGSGMTQQIADNLFRTFGNLDANL